MFLSLDRRPPPLPPLSNSTLQSIPLMLRPQPGSSPLQLAPPLPAPMHLGKQTPLFLQKSPARIWGLGGTSRGPAPSLGPSVFLQTGLKSRIHQRRVTQVGPTGHWAPGEHSMHVAPLLPHHPIWMSFLVSRTSQS